MEQQPLVCIKIKRIVFLLSFSTSQHMISMQLITDKQTQNEHTDLVKSTSAKINRVGNLPREIRGPQIYIRLDEVSLFGGLGRTNPFFHTEIADYSPAYYMGGEKRQAAFNYIRSLGSFPIDGYDDTFFKIHSTLRSHLKPPVIERESIILSPHEDREEFIFSALATIVHNDAEDKSSIPLEHSPDGPGFYKMVGRRFLIRGSYAISDTNKPSIRLLAVQHMGGGELYNKENDAEVVYGVNTSRTQLLIASYQLGGNTDSDGGNNRGVILHLISEKGPFEQKSWYLDNSLRVNTKNISQHTMHGSRDHLKIEVKRDDIAMPYRTFFVRNDGTIARRHRKINVPMLGKNTIPLPWLDQVSHLLPHEQHNVEKIVSTYVATCYTTCQMRNEEKPRNKQEEFTTTTTLLKISDNNLIRHKSFLKFVDLFPRFAEDGKYETHVVNYCLSKAHWSSQELVELAAILYKGGDRHYSAMIRNTFLATIWGRVHSSRQEINPFDTRRTKGLLWGYYYNEPDDTTLDRKALKKKGEKFFPLATLNEITFEQEEKGSEMLVTDDNNMHHEQRRTPAEVVQRYQKILDVHVNSLPSVTQKTEQPGLTWFSFQGLRALCGKLSPVNVGTSLFSPLVWLYAKIKTAMQ
jgi:hypothetical protein